MSLLTRRGKLLGASVRLDILTDMSGPYSEDASPGPEVAAKLAVEDFVRIHPELGTEPLAADAGTKTDTYGCSMVKS